VRGERKTVRGNEDSDPTAKKVGTPAPTLKSKKCKIKWTNRGMKIGKVG